MTLLPLHFLLMLTESELLERIHSLLLNRKTSFLFLNVLESLIILYHHPNQGKHLRTPKNQLMSCHFRGFLF